MEELVLHLARYDDAEQGRIWVGKEGENDFYHYHFYGEKSIRPSG